MSRSTSAFSYPGVPCSCPPYSATRTPSSRLTSRPLYFRWVASDSPLSFCLSVETRMSDAKRRPLPLPDMVRSLLLRSLLYTLQVGRGAADQPGSHLLVPHG